DKQVARDGIENRGVERRCADRHWPAGGRDLRRRTCEKPSELVQHTARVTTPCSIRTIVVPSGGPAVASSATEIDAEHAGCGAGAVGASGSLGRWCGGGGGGRPPPPL